MCYILDRPTRKDTQSFQTVIHLHHPTLVKTTQRLGKETTLSCSYLCKRFTLLPSVTDFGFLTVALMDSFKLLHWMVPDKDDGIQILDDGIQILYTGGERQWSTSNLQVSWHGFKMDEVSYFNPSFLVAHSHPTQVIRSQLFHSSKMNGLQSDAFCFSSPNMYSFIMGHLSFCDSMQATMP